MPAFVLLDILHITGFIIGFFFLFSASYINHDTENLTDAARNECPLSSDLHFLYAEKSAYPSTQS